MLIYSSKKLVKYNKNIKRVNIKLKLNIKAILNNIKLIIYSIEFYHLYNINNNYYIFSRLSISNSVINYIFLFK